MGISTQCPSCLTPFVVPDELAQKWVHCASCRARFQVRPRPPAAEAPTTPAQREDGPPSPARARRAEPPPRPPAPAPGPNVPKALLWVLVVLGFGVVRLFTGACVSPRRGPAVNPPAWQPPPPVVPNHHWPRFMAEGDQVRLDGLVEQLRSPDRKVRIEAARLLSRLVLARQFQGDDRVPRELARCLEDRDPECAEAAAEALRTWATREQVPQLVRALAHPSRPVRKHALEALARFRPPPAEATAALAGLLDTQDGRRAKEVLLALGPEAEPALARCLKHASTLVRLEVCRVLARTGTGASAAELTAVARNDESQDVREAAARAAELVGRRR